MKAHGLNPRIKKSPFFDATVASGATEFHPYNGMWMPVGYDTPVNEYWNTVERAGLWDVSVQRVVEISGPDALAFMELLTPRRVASCAVGQCRYIFLCNQDGGILNDPVMLRIAEDRFWITSADGDMYLWSKGIAVFAGLDVRIETPPIYPLQLQGPASPRIAVALFGESILDLGYYRWMWVEMNGLTYLLSRTGFSSELGFEIYLIEPGAGIETWNHILEVGRPHGLSPGSPNRIRRIEGGILDFAADMTPDDNPFEMGLGPRVAFDKGDFIGKAALRRIAEEGPSRIMRGALMEGPAFEKNNEHKWPVVDAAGELVGAVSSAVYSPRLARNIGHVLMDAPHAALGGRFTVQTAEGERELEVTTMPLWDPEKKIPRAPLRDAL